MKVHTVMVATATRKGVDVEIEGIGVFKDPEKAKAKCMVALAELLSDPEMAEEMVEQGAEFDGEGYYFKYEDVNLCVELNCYELR